jgi:hypothetical protein
MIICRKTHLLFPLLVLSMTLTTAAAVHAQSASLQINFGTAPHWTSVSGTRVEMIPMAERPGYDVFRYGGSYYAYNNNRWYSSRQMNGQFDMIDDQYVPNELTMVPREHWRNYPSTWQDRRHQGPDEAPATLQISFGSSPRWMMVRGTNVRMIRHDGRRGYDMFCYNRNYYVYSNNRWYMSRRWRGQFNMIDDRRVPRQLTMVPREHWRNYPTAWVDENDNSRYDRNGRRR